MELRQPRNLKNSSQNGCKNDAAALAMPMLPGKAKILSLANIIP
jgi:hypothetical protein